MQPIPFAIVTDKHGFRTASNGHACVTLAEPDGDVILRRGIKGIAMSAAGDRVLPLLNQLAGHLVKQPDMPARDLFARLQALAGMVNIAEPQNVEWVVAELDGVHVYCDGKDVIVTRRRDLTP